ncbi:hypothetical protein, partial [Mesorhizobium sp. M4B.F.Ca.ET.214.01.1.1]|uniref:hypothetical protein n=1 Tax=Mesorhizobium sp. M4B.F.Ca.ET.214.01.1.1 TaxID=2563955 RepID=UPI001093DF79
MTLFRMVALAALVLANSAEAADMAFCIKNLRKEGVAVELFSRDREIVWPGNDKVFLIRPGAKKSVPISCDNGEHICWGAWVNGDDSVTAGVGPDNDRACDTCCFICTDHSTETVDLAE